MFVYLLSNGSAYKIGISKHPEKRVKQLQTGSSEVIVLINKYKSKYYTKIETALHSTYGNISTIGNEWFNLSEEDVNNFLTFCKKIECNLYFLEENKI